jgi:hypothetical protein
VCGSDTTLAEPSVLLACTVLYPNTDPSLYLRTSTVDFMAILHFFLTLSFSPKFRSDRPQFSTRVSVPASSPPKMSNTFSPMNFAPGTHSGSLLSACEAPVFLPADQVLQLEFVPNMSDSSLGLGGHEIRGIESAMMKV